jgi:hypothetical protein
MMELSPIALSLLSSIAGGLVVAFVNHLMTRQREHEKKLADLRIQHLIESWRKIEKASVVDRSPSSRDKMNSLYDGLEDAVANIMLLGTQEEVELARKFSRELAEKRTSSANELLNALRASLRAELGLKVVPDMNVFLRMSRD